MTENVYRKALADLISAIEAVFIDDREYCLNYLEAQLGRDIYFDEMDEDEIEDTWNFNAYELGGRIAFGRPFECDSDTLDRWLNSIRESRKLVYDHEEEE
jgi:hypothetical protein